MSTRTAKCPHGAPWWSSDCPHCGRDPASEEERGKRALAEMFEARMRRMEEWHTEASRLFALAYLEAEERMVASGVEALRDGIWGDGT